MIKKFRAEQFAIKIIDDFCQHGFLEILRGCMSSMKKLSSPEGQLKNHPRVDFTSRDIGPTARNNFEERVAECGNARHARQWSSAPQAYLRMDPLATLCPLGCRSSRCTAKPMLSEQITLSEFYSWKVHWGTKGVKMQRRTTAAWHYSHLQKGLDLIKTFFFFTFWTHKVAWQKLPK